MQYSRLGQSGLIVSRLAFGAMTFTGGNSDIPSVFKVDRELAETLVRRALDAGVNYFDTADVYAGGESEILLGKALKSRRNDIVISTKVGFRSGAVPTQAGLSARHILSSVDASLQRLGTDWIDLYVVHREDPLTPLEETLTALDRIVRAGKVRYLGFSNWPAWKAAAALEIQKANGLAPFSHGQMHYSLLGRDVERDVLPMMERYGLGLTVWSPLAAGFLSGKYTPDTLSDPGSRFSGFTIIPFDHRMAFGLVDRMRVIAERRGASVAQVAIAWLLAKPGVSSILLGATSRAQLDDNLAATDLTVTTADVDELDTATPLAPVYPHWFSQFSFDQRSSELLAAAAQPGRSHAGD